MGEVCSLTHSHSLIAWLAASDSTWDLGQTQGKEHAARSSWLSQVSFLSRPSAQLSPAGASALLVSCHFQQHPCLPLHSHCGECVL